jgi:hypothetical protein
MFIDPLASNCEELEVIIATASEGYPARNPAHGVSYQSVEKFALAMRGHIKRVESWKVDRHV